MKIIFALIGKTGAGKESVANAIDNSIYGCEDRPLRLRFSDPINSALDVLELERSRPNQQKISEVLRNAFGQELFSAALKIKILKTNNPYIIVDGVRKPKDLAMLRDLAQVEDPRVVVKYICISTSVRARYERIKLRADRPGDSDKTFDQFQEEQRAETERDIDDLIKDVLKNDVASAVFIDNDGTLDELDAQVKERLFNSSGLV